MNNLAKAFKNNDLTSNLLNALPCGVLIISADGTVLRLNNMIEHIFRVKNAEVIGDDFGKALCCINSCDDRDICGFENGCRDCEVRKLALMALYSNEKKRRRVSLQVNLNRSIKDVSFLICAAPFKYSDDRFILLTIEDITNLKSILPPRVEDGFRGIVCKDEKMKALCEMVKQIGPSNTTVLIQGESGTGKELVALAIHKESRRANRRFVTVNCGALPPGLLESELFGHVKGAFTGALYDKKGRFELANGGTIFLDEVAELSPEMQVKFLRILQDGVFERVGATDSRQVDVRVISATNLNLKKEVDEGNFRKDLYYRLCVIPVTIPPLRERIGDIEILSKHFLKEFGGEFHDSDLKFSQQTLSILRKHDWPGNCRELQNVIQYALVKCRGDAIEPDHLPPSLFESDLNEFVRRRQETSLNEDSVLTALQKAGGNKRLAADLLGVSRSTLYRFFDRQREKN